LVTQLSLRSSLDNAEPVLRESAVLTSMGSCQRKPRLIISQVLQADKMTVTVSEDEDGSPDFPRPAEERPFMHFRLRMLVAARYAKSMGEVVDCIVISLETLVFAAS
jgi:hypothetical protein